MEHIDSSPWRIKPKSSVKLHEFDTLPKPKDLPSEEAWRATLNKLAVAVTRRHESFADPALQDVLDQIELRAHVELAKLEQLDPRLA